MKILYINNFFSAKGGAESIMMEEAKLMRQRGHEVSFFACDRQPFFLEAAAKTEFFPQYLDIRESSTLQKLGMIPKTIANREAQDKLTQLLKVDRPDIIHIHNLHYQLTPAIIAACETHHIPTVMTLHDVRIVCPGGTFYNQGQSESLCQTGNPWACLKTRCKNQSLSETLLCFTEFYFNQLTQPYQPIQKFITPSLALKTLMEQQGLPSHKIVHINNFLDDASFEIQASHHNQGYFLYVGRLSPEKGIQHLLEAMTVVPHLQLHIVGTGPYENELKQQAQDLNLNNVQFFGYMPAYQLIEQYQNCLATVMPVVWFEIFGLTIIESFLHGKPVIGTKLGALPELITDGKTGRLVEPMNHQALANSLAELASDPQKAVQMGQAGRSLVEQKYTSRQHQEALEQLYLKVLVDTASDAGSKISH